MSGYRDLGREELWAPVHTRSAREGWVRESWEEARLPGELNYDVARVVFEQGGGVRAVAIDPAVNVLVPGIEARIRAGRELILHQLGRGRPVENELRALARSLGVPRPPWQHTTLYAVAVAELSPAGRCDAWLAGDAEVWVCQGGVWREAVEGDMLAPAGRELWETELLSARGDEGGPPAIEELWSIQERLLDDPTLWHRPLLGFTQSSQHAHVSLEGVEEVILCTDGLRMSAERCERWQEWVRGELQRGEVHPNRPSPHGDLALLHLRRDDTSER